MASGRIRRREPCSYENCGSRRFHVGDDGFTYCDQGHQQSERGTVIAEDTGELVIHGTKSRKRDSDAESTTSKASGFSGAKAFQHYLLCVQLVLRKQLHWLVHVQGMPEELEALTRDLWALRMQKLRVRISYESDAETDAESPRMFSSQSESESQNESRSMMSQSSRRSRKRDVNPGEETPALAETISLCYIGMLLLRLPITVADIRKWSGGGQLLYYRATREVPLGMRTRLDGRYQELLEPQELLQAQAIHQGVLQMLTMLNTEFGMEIPAINTPLILFRWTQALALPLEVYVACQRLARILNLSMTFTTGGSSLVLRYPEVQLMALVVIATKLLFPFDQIERHPESSTDIPLVRIDWEEWFEAQESDSESAADPTRLNFATAFNFKESDCIDVSTKALDAYLDWYSDNIATEEIRDRGRAGKDAHFRRALFQMFPLQQRVRRAPQAISPADLRSREKSSRVQSHLSLTHVVEPAQDTQDLPRPGSFYRRYKSIEELFGPAKMLFEKAAELAALPLDAMVQAVFLIERRLQRYEDALRKQEKEG